MSLVHQNAPAPRQPGVPTKPSREWDEKSVKAYQQAKEWVRHIVDPGVSAARAAAAVAGVGTEAIAVLDSALVATDAWLAANGVRLQMVADDVAPLRGLRPKGRRDPGWADEVAQACEQALRLMAWRHALEMFPDA